MKNNRYSFGYAGIFAALGFAFCLINCKIFIDTPIGCVLWTAQVFAVVLVSGCLGQEVGFFLKRKKIRVIRKRPLVLSLVIALVSGILIGTAGQIIYSLETEAYTKDKVVNVTTDKTNVSFLVDYSPSMDSLKADCTKASIELLDFLDEKTAFQFVAFTSCDIDETNHATDMLPVNDTNRTYIKKFIEDISIFGYGTNFNIPLDYAVNELTEKQSDDTRSVIIILTDCQGFVDQSVVENIKRNNCELYVLTIGNTVLPNNQLEAIADKYFQLSTNSDGKVNVSDVVSALKEAVTGSQVIQVPKTRLTLSQNLLVGHSELTVLRIIVRILFFGLLVAAAGFIYYGFEGIKYIVANFCTGALAAIFSFIYLPLGLSLLLIIALTDYTKYIVEEENENV